MADTPISVLRAAIKEYLRNADLSRASSKKVRIYLNEKFSCDFTDRKKEIDRVVMDVLTELEGDKKEEDEASNDSASEADGDYSEEDLSEDEKPPKKKAKPSGRKSKGDDSDYDDSDSKPKRASNGVAKRKSGGGGGGNRAGKATGYLKKLRLSEELAEVMGEELMARNEVVKKMYAIVKDRDLLDPKNRQFAILDSQLQKVFGQKRIRMFGMMKLLGKHFSAAD